MTEKLVRVTYNAQYESRESGYVFYAGWVKGELDPKTGQPKEGKESECLFNPGIFELKPGDNYLTPQQVEIIKAYTGFEDKIEKKIIEVEKPVDMQGAQPTEKPENETQNPTEVPPKPTENPDEVPPKPTAKRTTGG